jgi:hypothetical protein
MAAQRLGAVILVDIFEELLPDIYQNRGFEYSATILQVASKSPLPAVPGGRGARGISRAKPERGSYRKWEKNLFFL